MTQTTNPRVTKATSIHTHFLSHLFNVLPQSRGLHQPVAATQPVASAFSPSTALPSLTALGQGDYYMDAVTREHALGMTPPTSYANAAAVPVTATATATGVRNQPHALNNLAQTPTARAIGVTTVLEATPPAMPFASSMAYSYPSALYSSSNTATAVQSKERMPRPLVV